MQVDHCIASCASQIVHVPRKERSHRVQVVCYRATGDDTRSLCTTVCKWTYLGHAHLEQMSSEHSVAMKASGWDDLFWQEIGLGDLVESGYATIGTILALPFSCLRCLLFSTNKNTGSSVAFVIQAMNQCCYPGLRYVPW